MLTVATFISTVLYPDFINYAMFKYFASIFFFAILSLRAKAQNSITFLPADPRVKISRFIYGQFAEHLGHGIYGGVWVGPSSTIPNTRGMRNDVVSALREAKVPVIRWPGGCFADEYHWMDGIGTPGSRPSMINTNWGGITEDNSFGTHEFMDLCQQVGAEAYVTGNLGSGTVREMSQWVEYLTSPGKSPMTMLRTQNGRAQPWKVQFWGLGNESWGCGGNMQAGYYANEMKRYSTFCKNYTGNHLTRIAVGPNNDDYNWTKVLMREAGGFMDGLSLHYYTLEHGWNNKGSATQFGVDDWNTTMLQTLKMEDLLKRHSEIMDRYDPKKRVGLMVDEWGNWFDVEPGTNPGFLYQQNTIRDAVVAATNLNIFNNHADRVKMSCIAQMVNVLQALVLTHGEQMIRTPTYYVFKLFSAHMDAELLPLSVRSESLSGSQASFQKLNASASRDREGRVHISMCNLDPLKAIEVGVDLTSLSLAKVTSARIVSSAGMTDYNDFGHKEVVTDKNFNAYALKAGKLTVQMPARSVVMLELR